MIIEVLDFLPDLKNCLCPFLILEFHVEIAFYCQSFAEALCFDLHQIAKFRICFKCKLIWQIIDIFLTKQGKFEVRIDISLDVLAYLLVLDASRETDNPFKQNIKVLISSAFHIYSLKFFWSNNPDLLDILEIWDFN